MKPKTVTVPKARIVVNIVRKKDKVNRPGRHSKKKSSLKSSKNYRKVYNRQGRS